jgi:basic membrane lipoprotein Med (substrate-binding protein (PBP1-ABC) superfamily)
MYYGRIYECKFITGAIAGAMAERDEVGYVAGYPIFGEPASINAFALGVRMTNPRARVKLLWSCTRKDAVDEFVRQNVTVLSNRDAAGPDREHWALEWGTYKLQEDGELLPLAVSCWNWGAFYGKLLQSVLKGELETGPADRPINYWLGMDSGVIDIQLSEGLPDGVHSLAKLLQRGLTQGSLDPFYTRIYDREGVCRNDGSQTFSPEMLMRMDWLCDNVDGDIPAFETLLPGSRELVRLLGLYREQLPPVTEEKQL